MGVSFEATNSVPLFPTDNIIRISTQIQKQPGYLSFFLSRVLREISKKHEFRRIDNGIYVTKHELHLASPNSSLIRKIYITPSTVLYEGPYQEEKCLVTRHFGEVQDGFLRVTFRDEG